MNKKRSKLIDQLFLIDAFLIIAYCFFSKVITEFILLTLNLLNVNNYFLEKALFLLV